MSEDFRRTLTRLRNAHGWSRTGLADRIGYTYQYVWEQETGRKPPTTAFANACDRALDADGALTALLTKEVDVERRTVLGIGTLAPLAAMETIRKGLARSVAGASADVVNLEEWDELAWEYGHTFMTTPPNVLIRDLSTDFLTAQQLIEESTDRTRAGYCRVASRLAVITAMTSASLGEHRQAWRWWRTARVTADASQDLDTKLWCRDWEVVNGLYEQRPMRVILNRADEAVALGGGRPTPGTVGLWAGIAQANAVIGRTDEAERALHQVEALADRLPVCEPRDADSMYGWHEYRLRHTESYVHSHLGNTKRAYAAQDRAFQLYPDSMFRERAQMRMHRAACLVRDGEIADGIEHARNTIENLPDGHQSNELVMAVGRKVLEAVPKSERSRDTVLELARMMA
ncbi:MAG: helix-turn-helix domain-containing protein [Micromonosporaceae bacterium]